MVIKKFKTRAEYEAFLEEQNDKFKGTPSDEIIYHRLEAGEIVETLVSRHGKLVLRIHVLDREVLITPEDIAGLAKRKMSE